MDFFSLEFLTALMSIVIIDLVLAGDNAIVIGLAARNLPKHMQKKVIIWGTLGAIVIRAAATFVVVWLLKIPFLLLAGGLILLWIAYKLMTEEKQHDEGVKPAENLFAAIRTILIADVVMGLDNVLAIAGASHGNFVLVVLGLLISVPIVIFGSTIILKFVDRYPIIITIGAGVLAYTAAKMITSEPFLHGVFKTDAIKWGFVALVTIVLLLVGRMRAPKQAKATMQ
jgi:YjbE family integral membrane protein